MIDRRSFAASLALAGLWFSKPALTQAPETDTLMISNGFARATAGMAMSGVS